MYGREDRPLPLYWENSIYIDKNTKYNNNTAILFHFRPKKGNILGNKTNKLTSLFWFSYFRYVEALSHGRQTHSKPNNKPEQLYIVTVL